MVLDSKAIILGWVAGCKIEAQCKGRVGADSVSSLIVVARFLGGGFENMNRLLF